MGVSERLSRSQMPIPYATLRRRLIARVDTGFPSVPARKTASRAPLFPVLVALASGAPRQLAVT